MLDPGLTDDEADVEAAFGEEAVSDPFIRISYTELSDEGTDSTEGVVELLMLVFFDDVDFERALALAVVLTELDFVVGVPVNNEPANGTIYQRTTAIEHH